MKMNIELYASLMPLLPPGKERFRREIDVDEGTTVQQVIDRFGIADEQAHLVLLNGHFVNGMQRHTTQISAGDTVSIWPPVAGG
jgi:thiamine biosynthesis protein ThiS